MERANKGFSEDAAMLVYELVLQQVNEFIENNEDVKKTGVGFSFRRESDLIESYKKQTGPIDENAVAYVDGLMQALGVINSQNGLRRVPFLKN
jgi:hypothetical protein